jgi:hypothetical protein
VAIAALVDAAASLGLNESTTEPLPAEDVYVVEGRLGLDRR